MKKTVRTNETKKKRKKEKKKKNHEKKEHLNAVLIARSI